MSQHTPARAGAATAAELGGPQAHVRGSGDAAAEHGADTGPRALLARSLGRLSGYGRWGVALLLIALFVAVAAPLISPFDPALQISGAHLVGPSGTHLLGTDELNRDLLSRVFYGVRTSLQVAFLAVPLGAILGVGVGLLAVSWRWVDAISARLFDVVLAFPTLILVIAITAVRGPGLVTVVIAIAIAEIPLFGRLTRTEAARALTAPYVEVSRVAGAGQFWVLTRHVLPSISGPLLVQAALSFSLAVFVESAMSFIGVGVRPPQPSLGVILSEGVYNWDVNPGYALGPLVAIVFLSLAFLLIARNDEGARRG